MPLDPYLHHLLERLPGPPREVAWASYREAERRASDLLFAETGQPGPAVQALREATVPVAGGTIDLLVYIPFGTGPHAAHLFLHGGGWVVGSIRHAVVDATCRERCVGASCVVVSVGYRKAPEHAFPLPLDDCYAALVWLSDHADELQIRRDRVTVGGQSAGANLAAALALKSREAGGPPITFQLLEIPALDLRLARPSHLKFGVGYGLTRRDMERFRHAYLGDLSDAAHPYASPALAPDLSGLPPAHIMTAEFDPLRDDGETYASRLGEAGVNCTHTMHPGHIHGSGGFTRVMRSARSWRDEVVGTLRAVHASTTR